MAPNETTFLEPPATPAPLFAYRALRGFIFGSPDPNESPERVPEMTDKENILPPLSSTTKEPLKNSHTPRLSPPKRKRGSEALAPPSSPTKGILRTPGALTPRAKALRDVNVKFRSVSPEVRRKDAKYDGVVAAAVTAAKGKNEPTKNTKGHNDRDTNTHSKDCLQKPPTASTTTAHSSSFDDYQRRTERQMKILIIERNKWRDMARRSGGENTRLKLQLTQAQRENERLQTKLCVLEPSQPSQSQQFPLPPDHVDRQGEHSRFAKKPKSKSNTNKDPTTTAAAPSSSHNHLPLRPLSPLTSLAQRLEPDSGPETAPESHGPARTGLAPDRYSAARARLQARQQARKASSSLRMGGGDGVGKTRQSMDEAEESRIDWAGLALG